MEKPLLYYDNNVGGTVNCSKPWRSMQCAPGVQLVGHGVRRAREAADRNPRLAPTNPYGRPARHRASFADYAASDPAFRYIALRYFNPTGAHASGRIGEDPNGVPNNLFPYLSQVAVGRREALRVWGKDYPTPDGTGVRDYIHVMDLAEGHVAALSYLERKSRSLTVNSGRPWLFRSEAARHARAPTARHPAPFAKSRKGPSRVCCDDPRSRQAARLDSRFDIAPCAVSLALAAANPQGY